MASTCSTPSDGSSASPATNRLADAAKRGATAISPDCLSDEYLTTSADKPLIELCSLVGRCTVPLAVIDGDHHLLGVVPRATLLGALATSTRNETHA
jgi:glycine betaine/proline transport system ATP-binding protein